jgi:hypothetical protein
MIEKAVDTVTGYALAAGVIAGAVVALPPALAVGYGIAVASRPMMRRHAELMERAIAAEEARRG